MSKSDSLYVVHDGYLSHHGLRYVRAALAEAALEEGRRQDPNGGLRVAELAEDQSMDEGRPHDGLVRAMEAAL